MNYKNPVQRAADELGSMSALANALGVSREAVRQWCSRNQVPLRRVLQIEAATKGKVTRHELSPDIYPA